MSKYFNTLQYYWNHPCLYIPVGISIMTVNKHESKVIKSEKDTGRIG